MTYRTLALVALLAGGCEGLDLDSSAPPRPSEQMLVRMTFTVANRSDEPVRWYLTGSSNQWTWEFAARSRMVVSVECWDGELLANVFTRRSDVPSHEGPPSQCQPGGASFDLGVIP